MLRQQVHRLTLSTRGPGFLDVTDKLQDWLAVAAAGDGLVTAFVQHTSASLAIQESTDPDVRADLLDALDRLAPRTHPYRHALEGPDDMPGHIKAMLSATSLSIPVIGGRAALGTWQALYLIEHRDGPHQRNILLHYVGT
ncbi:MAG: secondary thiamine-phosphate synthase enzyme YjbQ [Hyphomicrobiaceae bacterium]|nr:secondary thiamine-phosphate synthase enzyme YjbQ [Hyphomicrobiaceae bacterium]